MYGNSSHEIWLRYIYHGQILGGSAKTLTLPQKLKFSFHPGFSHGSRAQIVLKIAPIESWWIFTSKLYRKNFQVLFFFKKIDFEKNPKHIFSLKLFLKLQLGSIARCFRCSEPLFSKKSILFANSARFPGSQHSGDIRNGKITKFCIETMSQLFFQLRQKIFFRVRKKIRNFFRVQKNHEKNIFFQKIRILKKIWISRKCLIFSRFFEPKKVSIFLSELKKKLGHSFDAKFCDLCISDIKGLDLRIPPYEKSSRNRGGGILNE